MTFEDFLTESQNEHPPGTKVSIENPDSQHHKKVGEYAGKQGKHYLVKHSNGLVSKHTSHKTLVAMSGKNKS